MRLDRAVPVLSLCLLGCGVIDNFFSPEQPPPSIPSFEQCPPAGVELEACVHPAVQLIGPNGSEGRESFISRLHDLCNTPCRAIEAIELIDTKEIESFVDLKPVNRFQSIGTLRLRGTGLTNLRGLDQLRELGALVVEGNQNLSTLEGLQNVWNLQALQVVRNPRLVSLDGLGLRERAWRVEVTENQSLQTLAALSEVSEVNDVTISRNSSLGSIDAFNSIGSLSGSLTLEGNAALTTLNAFAKLHQVNGTLTIRDNPSLSRCELESLVYSVSCDQKDVANNSANGACN